jgi:hypothetical protein
VDRVALVALDLLRVLLVHKARAVLLQEMQDLLQVLLLYLGAINNILCERKK